jgi:hypothetical protein
MTGVIIRFIFRGIEVMYALRLNDLVVHLTGRLRIPTFAAQPLFEELNQSINQPFLPADDVKATFVAMLLQNLT